MLVMVLAVMLLLVLLPLLALLYGFGLWSIILGG